MAWNDFLLRLSRRFLGSPAATRIHRARERAFRHIDYAAVAIKSIDDDQRHIGIIYRSEQPQELRLLHLAWNYSLANGVPDDSFLWIDAGIPKLRAMQLAARCRQVFRANGRFIPYGFSPPTDCFDADTAVHLFGNGDAETGLTCASFVLAMFEYSRLRLIRTKPGESVQRRIWSGREKSWAC